MLGARASWTIGTPARLRYTPSSNRQCERHVEIGRRAEALDERDRAGVGFGSLVAEHIDDLLKLNDSTEALRARSVRRSSASHPPSGGTVVAANLPRTCGRHPDCPSWTTNSHWRAGQPDVPSDVIVSTGGLCRISFSIR